MSTRTIGVIGGTGFGAAFGAGPGRAVETDYGPAQIAEAEIDGVTLLFLARHGAGHRLPPHTINHRANIAALQQAGAAAVFATAAVGSLREDYAPGDFVILDDLLDLTKGEVVTFFDRPGEVRHTDMGRPYAPRLRRALQETQPQTAKIHSGGTYLCLSGPRYETPAEIRLFAAWGADVVGMTSAPEAVLCRELGLPYAAVALVTNYGCGLLSDAPLTHDEVEERMAVSRPALRDWLLRAARACANPDFLLE